MERLNALNIRNRGLVTALFAYDDDFIDEGLRKLTLEQALFVYLQKKKYETIVFYSTANGFYSFDADMLGNFLSPVNEGGMPLGDVVVEQSPAGHSTGRRKFTRRRGGQNIGETVSGNVNVSRQNLNTTPDPFGRFKTRSIGDRNANMAEFGYNLRERKHLAVIVMASEDAPEFDPIQTNNLGTQLRDIEQYGRQQSNDNRLIIVIPADKCRENIMKCFNQQDHPIASIFLGGTFYNRFVQTVKIDKKDVETVNPQSTMVLSPPTKTDVKRVLMYSRVVTGLEKPVDWPHIDDICEQLSLGKQHKVTTMSQIMAEKKEYTYDAFKDERIKSRGSDINSLNQLIGLQGVKDQIQRFIDRIKLSRSRGEDITHMNKHMVFYGNPGTGKTTVARIVAGILKDLGLLKKGHLVEVSREHLVAGYVGQTAIQTRHVIDSALDGVLFVDEAYTLAGGDNDFGPEALNTLMTRMENDCHRLVVILAGYEQEMEKVYRVNPGLMSRLPNKIYFPDYNADELKQIFMLTARKRYTITPEVDILLNEIMAHVVDYNKCQYEKMKAKQAIQTGTNIVPSTMYFKFGNGRWVRNMLELIEGKVAARMAFSDTSVLIPEDFINLGLEELQDFTPGRRQEMMEQQESGMERLNAMIGLTQLKKEVKKLVKQARYAQMLKQQGMPIPHGIVSRHMVFLGNPGTGKTTVARILADIYYELGLLQKRTIVEVDRSKLVAQYEGQTGPRVNEIFDSALGGILFIDEAYALVRDSQRDSFGQEALDTLVKRIEDDKDKLVVILAGYDREMREFIAKNSGLKSRFNTYIHFQDYTSEEMLKILLCFLHDRGLETSAEVEEKLAIFVNQELVKTSCESGNGRWARNLADKLYEAHTSYCVDTGVFSSSLSNEELELGLRDFDQSQLKEY